MLPIVERYRDVYKHFSIDVDGYERVMKSEKIRRRANGDVVYYQNVFLHGGMIKRVYVKDERLIDLVGDILMDNGFNGVRVIGV